MALSVNDRYILDHRVLPLISAALIAEQRQDPFGPQSPALTEVMDFLRRSPDPDLPRYIVLDTSAGFVVAARAPKPGEPPLPLEPNVVVPTRADVPRVIAHRQNGDGHRADGGAPETVRGAGWHKPVGILRPGTIPGLVMLAPHSVRN